MSMTMRLAIAAGGTGGHIFPAVSVLEALALRHGSSALVLGREAGLERTLLGATPGVEYAAVRIRPFLRREMLKWPMVMTETVAAVLKAVGTLRRWKPDVVLGMGGYVAAPVVLAAALARFPVAIADQNALPGRANRRLAPWVKRVFCAYRESVKYFPTEKCRLTGIPLRKAICRSSTNPPFEEFGLKRGVFTILVFGGSQGAVALCEATREMLRFLDKESLLYQVLLQVGTRNLDWATNARLPGQVRVAGMIENMAGAYACADLVVCRSGAVSLAEMAVQGKPAILVPYPFAKDDHQSRNAEVWENAGAAHLIRQSALTGENLANMVIQLMKDRETLVAMSNAALNLARPDAAEAMLRELEEMIH